MELVAVTETHYEFIRNLRMHPKNLKWFLNQSEITAEDQVNYMEKHAQDYRVCLLYGEPVGYVGVIENDIRICTHHLLGMVWVISCLVKLRNYILKPLARYSSITSLVESYLRSVRFHMR